MDLDARLVNDTTESQPFSNSTRIEGSARFSPAESRIAFASLRSGLPAEIDLSSSKQDLYPSGVTIPGLGIQGSMASVTIPASPVAWGLTIASNSRNRDKATAFVEQLLGPLGRKALATNGPQPLPRARVSRSDYQRLPETLQPLTSTN